MLYLYGIVQEDIIHFRLAKATRGKGGVGGVQRQVSTVQDYFFCRVNYKGHTIQGHDELDRTDGLLEAVECEQHKHMIVGIAVRSFQFSRCRSDMQKHAPEIE
jgi:hypothetical protein